MTVHIATEAAFSDWMRKVNSRIGSLTLGLSAMDIPDTDYRARFDGGVSPEEAADEALDEAGYPFRGADDY